MLAETILAMLDGSRLATYRRPDGRPCPLVLPDDPGERCQLVEAHIAGGPAVVQRRPARDVAERVRIDCLELGGYCPAPDGLVRWLAVDLDGGDHGQRGLADPAHATRTIAERCDHFGLSDGLMVARSRGGIGRHIFLIPPEPVPLADAVVGLAQLVAAAYRVAAEDEEFNGKHAFNTVAGIVARPGAAGAVELLPRSDHAPPIGWSLSLPAPDRLIDPLAGDRRAGLDRVPRCHFEAWDRLIAESRRLLRRQERSRACRKTRRRRPYRRQSRQDDPLRRISAGTKSFLESGAPEGERNLATFAAACNLLACGVPEHEARDLVLAAASRSGLPEREAEAAFRSAARRTTRGAL